MSSTTTPDRPISVLYLDPDEGERRRVRRALEGDGRASITRALRASSSEDRNGRRGDKIEDGGAADSASAVDAAGGDEIADVQVMEVSSPAEVRDVLERRPVDCLVTEFDIASTGATAPANGLAFAEAMLTERPSLPVILYTDSGDERVAARAVEVGVDGYVPKAEGSTDRLAKAIGRAIEVSADHERVRREWQRVESIHDVTFSFETCETAAEVYRRAVTVLEDLLPTDATAVYVEMEELLVPQVTGGELGSTFDVFTHDEAIVGQTYLTGEPHRVDRMDDSEAAYPGHEAIQSGVSVPAGTDAVIQVVSTKPRQYDDQDVKLVELVATHVAAAVTRIESEAEVRREHQRFVSLFENVPDAVAITDDTDEEIVLAVNPAFESVFGYDASEIVGESINDWIVPEKEEPIHPDDVGDGGEILTGEVTRQTADGPREFLFRGFGVGVEGEGHHYGIYTDITERKERERELARRTTELERHNERLDQFAGTLSHDLRNPLTLAMGQLEHLQDELLDESTTEPVQAALEDVHWSVGRMEELIEDMLVLARSGQSVTETESADVEVIARRAARTVGVEDHLEVAASLPTVEADAGRLTAAFENLFRNALEHATDEDDSLTVRVEPVGESGFAVEDDGPGVAPDQREDVFESGYTTDTDGTGFGLAIVSEVVESHGWSIRLTDGDLGGARFEFEP